MSFANSGCPARTSPRASAGSSLPRRRPTESSPASAKRSARLLSRRSSSSIPTLVSTRTSRSTETIYLKAPLSSTPERVRRCRCARVWPSLVTARWLTIFRHPLFPDRVCVPVDPKKVFDFDPDAVPTVGKLIRELNEAAAAQAAKAPADGSQEDVKREAVGSYPCATAASLLTREADADNSTFPFQP
jgi:hypothetical protein